MPRATQQNRSLQLSLLLGGRLLPVEIDLGRRKQLYISVYPDGRILVRAPRWLSEHELKLLLEERRGWIETKLAEYEQSELYSLGSSVEEGAELYYLGRRYRLRLFEAERAGVCLRGREICLSLPAGAGTAEGLETLERWYLRRARRVFTARLALCHQRCQGRIRKPLPDLLVRQYSRSWGRCSASGLVSLNSELVKTPLACIDYVIVHELCHLIEHNHSPRFYALLGACMPDWKKRKARLDKYIL